MSKGALRYQDPAQMPAGMRKLFEQQQRREVVISVDIGKDDMATIAAVERHPNGSMTVRGGEATLYPPRHATHRAGEMNKTEARYAQQLEARKTAGEVRWYAFERMKLRLAPATFFTVDFFVQLEDGSFECHEVKGRKGDRYFAEEDAKLKIKVAAEMFPIFRFLIVWPAKGGGWRQERFG